MGMLCIFEIIVFIPAFVRWILVNIISVFHGNDRDRNRRLNPRQGLLLFRLSSWTTVVSGSIRIRFDRKKIDVLFAWQTVENDLPFKYACSSEFNSLTVKALIFPLWNFH